MPNIKSQKDRVVQSKKEALHNKAIKSNLKTVVKKADAAIAANAADKEAVVVAAISAIDKEITLAVGKIETNIATVKSLSAKIAQTSEKIDKISKNQN